MAVAATDFSGIYLEVVNPIEEFYKMVTSTNIIIRNASTSDIDSVASYQALPRVGLILSAAKNLDNTPLFGGDSAEERFSRVSLEMREGVYSSGIRRVISALTASILTRTIPLQGNINQIAVGDMLEKQALEDLDRIVTLFQTNKAADVLDSNKSKLEDSIYLGLGVIPSTLKAFNPNDNNAVVQDINVFDILDPSRTLEENIQDEDGTSKFAVNIEGARTYKRVPYLGDAKYAYCYIALSTLDDGVTIGSKLLETGFYISSDSKDFEANPTFNTGDSYGWNGEQIIEKLADQINTASLSTSVSNVLVSPNVGSLIISSVSLRKSKIFPDVENYSTPFINQYRRATATLGYKLHSLTFDVRRYSSVVQNELITITFYTVNSLGLTASQVRSSGTIGVKGLWYGINANYNNVDESGPKSLLISTNKGKTSATGTSSNAPTPQYEKEKDLLNPDTLYFRFVDPSVIDAALQIYQKPLTNVTPILKPAIIPSVIGILRWRVSTTPALENNLPVEYSFDVSTILDSDTDILAPEKIARAFLDSIYNYTKSSTLEKDKVNPNGLIKNKPESSTEYFITSPNQGNNVLGALVHSNAVQIIAFRSLDYNSKAIVDILEVPTNIEIATGTPLFYKSYYQPGPRSIAIETIPIKTKLLASSGTGSGGNDMTDKETLEQNPSTAQTVSGNKSVRLQSVYDRLDFLKNRRLN